MTEIFCLNSKENNQLWKSNYKKNISYDLFSKSYIVELNESYSIESNKLNLLEKYVLIQIYVQSGTTSIFEFGITDSNNNMKRIIYTSTSKAILVKPLHVRIPFANYPKNKWINLQIDLEGSIKYFNTEKVSLKSINFISIKLEGKLRKICLLRTSLKEIISSKNLLPKYLQMPKGVDIENVLVRMDDTGQLEEKEQPHNFFDFAGNDFSDEFPLMKTEKISKKPQQKFALKNKSLPILPDIYSNTDKKRTQLLSNGNSNINHAHCKEKIKFEIDNSGNITEDIRENDLTKLYKNDKNEKFDKQQDNQETILPIVNKKGKRDSIKDNKELNNELQNSLSETLTSIKRKENFFISNINNNLNFISIDEVYSPPYYD